MVLYHLADTGISMTDVFILSFFMRSNVTYTTKQDSRVSCLAQTGFAAFGKRVQPTSWSLFAGIDNLVYVLLRISVSFKIQRFTYFAIYKPLF